MTLEFSCSKGKSSTDKWTVQAQLLSLHAPYEVSVSARGSAFHIICGEYAHGNFLCIPSHGIASELASFGDTFWNLERLRYNHPTFSLVDAISVIQAIKHISSYLE